MSWKTCPMSRFCCLGLVLVCAEGLRLGLVAGIAAGCAETDETSDGTGIMLWSGPSLGLVSSEMPLTASTVTF